MPKIRRLPEELANRIAAGEVVERPASVVKELVENSLDAGAHRIEVSLREGGRQLIVVVDDGCGMDREDAQLAVQRFATSKIADPEDLHRLETLGFRGEALPSIGAVSRLRIITRPPGAAEGTLVVVEGGELKRVESIGCPAGTRVEVADLFFNTPARRKFLSSANTERSHCHDWVLRLALGWPDRAFRLTHDGTTLLSVRGEGDLLAVLAVAYGSNAARQFLPVRLEDRGLVVWGYISGPRLVRATRQHQFFFVNGRFVRSRLLSHALTEAYGPLLPTGRQPLCALHLCLPAAEVDPNVHPTKIEVRFAAEGWVHDRVAEAVRRALEEAGLRPAPVGVASRPASKQPPTARHVIASRLRVGPLVDKLDARDDGLEVHGRPLQTLRPSGRAPEAAVASAERPQVLGQLGARYILARLGEDLLLIDQHRAAERVLLERLVKAGAPAQQWLAVPAPLELSPAQAAAAREHGELLAALGFVLEPFGPRGWLLRAVPAGMVYNAPQQFVSDLLEELAEWQAPLSAQARAEQLRAMAACHAAVKAGERLSAAEMQRLVEDLLATSSPAVCPHGDPVIVTVTLAELDRRFERPRRQAEQPKLGPEEAAAKEGTP
jgi:DNA mismatch repair protein MutL